MKWIARLRNLACLALIVAIPATATPPVEEATTHASIERWAQGVWNAARRGDLATMERQFDSVPGHALVEESADQFRAAVELLRTNRESAMLARAEKRAEALTEMREELEKENLAKALRQAVTIQTLADDYDEAFGDAEIMELVTWAEARVPELEADHLWLDAQELLYLLRTFYDDTQRRTAFDGFDTELQRLNRRVSLIALYAPEQLHNMRNDWAARSGEESFGDYNAARAVKWNERLEGVDKRMLVSGLNLAAEQHIGSFGWRPLIEGGLEALRLFVTTKTLAHTFPELNDQVHVARWIGHIDRTRAALDRLDDEDLSRWYLLNVLDDLVELNGTTLDLPMNLIFREFGDGATNSLDTYTEIVWPDELRRFEQATQGNFVGIGVIIRHNDKREVMVVNPLEGTPAYFAGMKSNDLIVEVNGDSTVGWALNDAVDRITGPRGTIVKLGVKREGHEDLIIIPIRRDVIKIRSVKGWFKEGLDEDREPIWDWYADPVNRIAYVRLTQFTEDTYSDLMQAWEEMCVGGRPHGLILDLRHNPGGLLTSAVRVSNLFVPRGSIVSGENKYGESEWDQTAREGRADFAGVPTVVLINRGAASAAEIVAGCLQAHDVGIVLGERSFGKGSVQTVHRIAANALIKLTTQYYRLPSVDGGQTPGRLVHKRRGAAVWGVDPDVEVPMSATQYIAAIDLRQAAELIPLDDDGSLNPEDPERANVNDLVNKGIDPQLETALILLQSQALAMDDVRHARKDH